MRDWTDSDCAVVSNIVETLMWDGEDAATSLAMLHLLSGGGHAVTRGLLWAQRMDRRRMGDTWRSLVSEGLEAALREVGPIWVDWYSGHPGEEWVDAQGEDLTPVAAFGVLQDAVYVRRELHITFGCGGTVFRVPQLQPGPHLTPLGRHVLMRWRQQCQVGDTA